MADAVLIDHSPDSSNYSEDNFDSLPVPPLDRDFLSAQEENFNFISDLSFSLDDNYDFDIAFDDLDDFYLSSENDAFSIPANSSSDDFGVANYLTSTPASKYHSASCNSGHRLNAASTVSSQGSENGGYGVSDSAAFVVYQKITSEEEGNNIKNNNTCDNTDKNGSVSKRKKDNSSKEDSETRIQKHQKSENASFVVANDEDEKRKARLIRNRESAQLSRQLKKHYLEELEEKVKSMHSTIADLNSKISYFMAENASLRQQLSSSGVRPPPVYPPMAPVPYPWVPCPPYVVKPQGSQLPLVPIPRLKPQQPVSARKSMKSEVKKVEGKTKKVASVSFLGLLFFALLFGGLVNVKFSGVNETGADGFVTEKYYDQHRRRVLIADGHLNGSYEHIDDGVSVGNKGYRIQCERSRARCLAYEAERNRGFERLPDAGELIHHDHNSSLLAASLYVPRNDKLVQIDGNLIIHSVLASERAISSRESPELNKNKETGLAIPGGLSPMLAIPGRYSHLHGHLNERQAFTSESSDTLKNKDHLKSSTVDGRVQQWFREGLAGPMLSSGMCNEVFQFDVSPKPGAIIPASSVSNIASERQHNATKHKKGRNRRILHGLPIPLRRSDLNITGEHVGTSHKDNFQGNKSVSPMVVSLLVDPREAGDMEVDGMISPNSFSQVFVVVLLDGVKYVTYSCGIPRSGPHLVTT